ncbi:MAG: lytic transglycosylase domain-containing protein [Rickettsiales bacterium]
MIKNKKILQKLLLLIALFTAQPAVAYAQIGDPLIEGAKLCTYQLKRYEAEYGIPQHLLSAIASTESGRFHSRLKIKLPWPWTINAGGKGYFFDTKEEAIEAAKELMAKGVESMDIGCMQVNIRHHPNAFSSLSQGFEPEYNVAYAANFLKGLYQEENSWRKAASNYHSRTPKFGTKYIGLVYNNWFQILDKLRAARLNVPSSSISALRDMQQAKLDTISPKYIKVGEEGEKSATYKMPSMKTIKVSSQGVVTQNNGARNRENGVIVVRPEIKVVGSPALIQDRKNTPPEPMVVADANPIGSRQSILDMPPSAGGDTKIQVAADTAEPEAKIIRLDNKLVRQPVNNVTNKKSGPNFIFND